MFNMQNVYLQGTKPSEIPLLPLPYTLQKYTNRRYIFTSRVPLRSSFPFKSSRRSIPIKTHQVNMYARESTNGHPSQRFMDSRKGRVGIMRDSSRRRPRVRVRGIVIRSGSTSTKRHRSGGSARCIPYAVCIRGGYGLSVVSGR